MYLSVEPLLHTCTCIIETDYLEVPLECMWIVCIIADTKSLI